MFGAPSTIENGWSQNFGAGRGAENTRAVFPPLIHLKNVSRSYIDGDQRVEVLSELELEVEAGAFVVIRGESGSGKTTLLRVLGLLDREFSGSYEFCGESVPGKSEWWLDELRSHNIGFVFQEGQLFDHLSVYDNLLLPLRLGNPGVPIADLDYAVSNRARDFFSSDELDNNVLGRRPKEVSGGQRQRGAIMRATSCLPPLILADEPTASLNDDYKEQVVKHLISLCDDGHTVIVVSHDAIFRDVGRQMRLHKGRLIELPHGSIAVETQYQRPRIGVTVFEKAASWAGWRPRADLRMLTSQIWRETIQRPLFLFLILVALLAGICQIAVFLSLMLGTQNFVDHAIKRGSRLNRLEIKPLQANHEKLDRFPERTAIRDNPLVESVVGRRESTIRMITTATDVGGRPTTTDYTAMGLHGADPEYRLLTFVAGGPFSDPPRQLEVIVTVALMNELFDMGDLRAGRISYDAFIGRTVQVRLRQFTSTAVVRNTTDVKLKVVGIIAYAEGGRQLYLPNTTLKAFDRFRMDRAAEPIKLPLNEERSGWLPDEDVDAFSDIPWEDRLHIYTRDIRHVVDMFGQLATIGYRPISDIWNFQWVLDIQQLVWRIFGPLLFLLVLVVGGTVWANIFTGAKLRERDFALWRILGMRIGDLTVTQLFSTILIVLAGTAGGLAAGMMLTEQGRAFLRRQATASSSASGTEPPPLDMIFAPIIDYAPHILFGAVIVGLLAAVYPAVRAARTDPAIILRS